VKNDVPMGAYRWLTVVSKEQSGGAELLLERDHPAVAPYKKALVHDGIPVAGPVRIAVFDDTCGNLIQLVQMTGAVTQIQNP
jgi:hypothetical protein